MSKNFDCAFCHAVRLGIAEHACNGCRFFKESEIIEARRKASERKEQSRIQRSIAVL